MTKQRSNKFNGIAAAIGLTMALGPLTALSVGSRFAPDQAWDRAYEGIDLSESTTAYEAYDITRGTPDYAQGTSLMDLLDGAGMFETFATAVREAGLENLLTSDTAYTIFVPTDEAFAQMSEKRKAMNADSAQVKDLVKSHIVPGRISATELAKLNTVRTINGEEIPISLVDDRMAAGVEVLKTDIARNGIIHIVDSVL